MNDPRRQATTRIEDEERLRRLREGGETQRAQAAMEEAQRSSRTGEGAGFSGLTPQEEERRRMMMAGGTRGYGETQQAQMSMWGTESQRGMEGGRRYETYTRREGPIEERPTVGEETERVAMGAGGVGAAGYAATRGAERPSERPMTSKERIASGDFGRARGGTYYYEGRESQAGGVAAPESSFGRTEYMPTGRPPVTQEPTPQQRMRETGGGAMERSREMGGEAAGRTREMGTEAAERTKQYGSQAVERTKSMGRRLSERTREATGGASAEDVANRAGESIGRGIRKLAAVGSGIIAGMRRGIGESPRRSEEEMRYREEPGMREERAMREEVREEVREPRVRETEYREVRRTEQRET